MNRPLCIVLAAALVSSCHVKNRLYNQAIPVPASIVAIEPVGNRIDRIDADCDPIKSACLAFLEFDEMGEMWQYDQLPKALALIEKAKQESPHPIIVTFTHGWKNNANDNPKDANGNVRGFEGVLEFLKTKKHPDIPIVGIYIGWRGDLISKYWPIRRQLSYFNRERAAIRIPGTSLTSALTQIMMTAHRDQPEARVVMVGHSFGGLVMERALSQAMADYVLRRRKGATERTGDVAWADLVVFVNSAAAASEGKQMLDMLKREGVGYAPRREEPSDKTAQWPLLLSISSLGDAATRFLVPVGHGPSYLSLELTGSWRDYQGTDLFGVKLQRSYYLSTTAHMEALQSHLIVEYPKDFSRCQQGIFPYGSFVTTANQTYVVCQKPGRTNDTAYWAMQMPATIVPDHSGIFNENFIGLLNLFLPSSQDMMDPSRQLILRPKQ